MAIVNAVMSTPARSNSGQVVMHGVYDGDVAAGDDVFFDLGLARAGPVTFLSRRVLPTDGVVAPTWHRAAGSAVEDRLETTLTADEAAATSEDAAQVIYWVRAGSGVFCQLNRTGNTSDGCFIELTAVLGAVL
jgi:hypothetical protein